MTVQFKHFRNLSSYWDEDGDEFYRYNSMGGVTFAITHIKAEFYGIGISVCSAKDGFNKKIGRDVAITRLNAQPYLITEENLNEIIKIPCLDYALDVPGFYAIADHFNLLHVIEKAYTW